MSYHKSVVVLGVVTMLIVSGVGPVFAHDKQTVEGYDLTFGGADEPLITGERMWLELEITDNETGEPVANQTETLTMKVQSLGHENFTLEVSEKHGERGVYEAPVIFTEPGEYIIHVTGNLKGNHFHTHFTTEVENRTEIMYPSERSQSNTTRTTQSN